MIHELRAFHSIPGRLPALLKRFEHCTLRLFEKHGIKPLGLWTVAIGECSNVCTRCWNGNLWQSGNKRLQRS